eukprot:838103-Rhodomonas_salina.1
MESCTSWAQPLGNLMSVLLPRRLHGAGLPPVSICLRASYAYPLLCISTAEIALRGPRVTASENNKESTPPLSDSLHPFFTPNLEQQQLPTMFNNNIVFILSKEPRRVPLSSTATSPRKTAFSVPIAPFLFGLFELRHWLLVLPGDLRSLAPYARPTPCPVLTPRILLGPRTPRVCSPYCDHATAQLLAGNVRYRLRACYAMSGTDVAYQRRALRNFTVEGSADGEVASSPKLKTAHTRGSTISAWKCVVFSPHASAALTRSFCTNEEILDANATAHESQRETLNPKP